MDLYLLKYDSIDREWYESKTSYLSAEEKQRSHQYIDKGARNAFLSGRILLRYLVANKCGVDPCEVKLGFTNNGKPFVFPISNSLREIQFNLSHGGGMVALGMFSSGSIGVDVERFPITTDLNLNSAADLVFTNEEREIWRSTRCDTLAFICLWTRIEASLKCLGVGLSDVSRRMTEKAHTLMVYINDTSLSECRHIVSYIVHSDRNEICKLRLVIVRTTDIINNNIVSYKTSFGEYGVEVEPEYIIVP